IMRQMLTQAQTAGQYFTNDQIKEMTRKVSAEVDLVHQQTQNQRYGSSHIGATAKDISNVVTDAASGEIGRASCRERVDIALIAQDVGESNVILGRTGKVKPDHHTQPYEIRL